MESVYLASISSVITDMLSSSTLHPGLDADLKQLQIKVNTFQSVLDDAYKRVFQEKSIESWLSELADVAKEALEIMEELEYQVLGAKVKQQQTDTSPKPKRVKLGLVFASTFLYDITANIKMMDERIKEIQERFDVMVKSQDQLQLKPMIDVMRRSYDGSLSHRHLIRESKPTEIYGRVIDEEHLTAWLLSDMTTNLAVFAIVGIGGSGKTTLARKVYDDNILDNHFDEKIWITVSVNFDVVRLTRVMLEHITGQLSPSKELSFLQDSLRDKLAGKRILLVLDDDWSMDRSLWETFTLPFIDKQVIVRVIVTTRSEAVAESREAQKIYFLSCLPAMESWALLAYYAFSGRDPQQYPQLKYISQMIAEKCRGLPLCLKSIGAVLQNNMDTVSWVMILKNLDVRSIEEYGMIFTLKLSYNHMPNYLKPCFLICSMFPHDYVFEKSHLARLWVALGYIQHSGVKVMEKKANEYVEELHQRSFFDNYLGEERFVMHDLFHDLALDISKNNSIGLRLNSSEMLKCEMMSIKRLHALILSPDVYELPSTEHNLNHLRYLSIPSQIKFHDSLCHMYNLRCLDLGYFQGIELPNEIGNLINLLYLILRYSHIQQLPESISRLSNLQMLDLCGCKELIELPCTIVELSNLRILNLYNSSIRCLPSEFSKVTKLETFYAVLSNKEIRQMKDMMNLEGMVCVQNIRLLCLEDCKEAVLRNKHQLESLRLLWHVEEDRLFHQNVQNLCFRSNGHSVKLDDDQGILENLEPHINLRELEISGYGGLKFPMWISNPLFNKLTKIQLVKCSWAISLPPVGQLPFLESLLIQEFTQIKSVGNEFYRSNADGNNTVAFPSLRHLHFEVMYQWEEWHGILDGDYPQLQELFI